MRPHAAAAAPLAGRQPGSSGKRAGGVPMQPLVNAGGVEAVAACARPHPPRTPPDLARFTRGTGRRKRMGGSDGSVADAWRKGATEGGRAPGAGDGGGPSFGGQSEEGERGFEREREVAAWDGGGGRRTREVGLWRTRAEKTTLN